MDNEKKLLAFLEDQDGDDLTEAFSRLPGHVIGNEFYVAQRALSLMYQSLIDGNDFNEKTFNKIIKELQSIKKAVKKFNKKDEVPVSYQYKKESKDMKEETENLNEATDLYDKNGITVTRYVVGKGGTGYQITVSGKNSLGPKGKLPLYVQVNSGGIDELLRALQAAKKSSDYKESIEEGKKMSADDLKIAKQVKKMYDDDEPMGQAAGLKLKAMAKELDRKYGKGWMKMVEETLEENAEVERIAKIVSGMKVGDKTNFGKILKIGKDSVRFKAPLSPETTIKFNQRKMGKKDYVLSVLAPMKEDVVNEDAPHSNYRHDSLYDAASKILQNKQEE